MQQISLKTTSSGGLQPGVDLDDSAFLLDIMEEKLNLTDANILVNTYRKDSPDDDVYSRWLENTNNNH